MIKSIAIQQDWRTDPTLDEIKLNTFDQVFVRKNPDFELQESVFIEGEVVVPGEYNKISRAESLSSLVKRSGGITELAYLEGAFLNRSGIGRVALNLEKAIRRPGSRHDIALIEGDQIVIPPRLGIVSITGNVLQPGTTVVFDPNHTKFKYYVNLAGGFDRKTRRKRSTVTYMDGRVKRARRFMGMVFYPRLKQGSLITVARKEEKQKKETRGGA